MREIKFRAWNTDNKRMILWGELLSKNLQNILSMPKYCGYELMQYTGLHDKNGKEIYQGYILKDRWNTIYVVKYRNIGFYMFRNNRGNRYSKMASWNGEKEVIGNIYENPDLLEKQ